MIMLPKDKKERTRIETISLVNRALKDRITNLAVLCNSLFVKNEEDIYPVVYLDEMRADMFFVIDQEMNDLYLTFKFFGETKALESLAQIKEVYESAKPLLPPVVEQIP